MGLSSFPNVGEGTLAVLIFHTIFSVALIKNLVVSLAQLVGAFYWASLDEGEQDWDHPLETERREKKRVSITQFKYLSHGSRSNNGSEFVDFGDGESCCVCLCGYEDGEEVSELISCKHFFHKVCLDSWFHNNRATCPICRSVV